MVSITIFKHKEIKCLLVSSFAYSSWPYLFTIFSTPIDINGQIIHLFKFIYILYCHWHFNAFVVQFAKIFFILRTSFCILLDRIEGSQDREEETLLVLILNINKSLLTCQPYRGGDI